MKKLTSSVYSFERIVNDWNLIQDDGSYFLARPIPMLFYRLFSTHHKLS